DLIDERKTFKIMSAASLLLELKQQAEIAQTPADWAQVLTSLDRESGYDFSDTGRLLHTSSGAISSTGNHKLFIPFLYLRARALHKLNRVRECTAMLEIGFRHDPENASGEFPLDLQLVFGAEKLRKEDFVAAVDLVSRVVRHPHGRAEKKAWVVLCRALFALERQQQTIGIAYG
ncbi:unnamed protein product, partial [Amoebophrya sp. A120]